MNRALPLAALLASGAAQAATVSGSGAFTVEALDPITFQVLDTGTGAFRLVNDQVTAFTFTMLGQTWTEAECDCVVINGEPSINLTFANDAGAGELHWRFDDGAFAFQASADGRILWGRSDGGDLPATGAFRRERFRVPEPASLVLFVLALIPWRRP